MSKKIREEVRTRLVLAKMLHKAGENACAVRNDQFAFTKGILLLHDAAEAALGAVADHLHAVLKEKTFLLQYYGLIQAADPQHRKVPYNRQMKTLNTLRIDAKHLGILPDIKSHAYLPARVGAFLEDVCKTYLGLDFSSVSLKSLIRDKTILQYINGAEKNIEQGKIEGALISLGYAMHHICESSETRRQMLLFHLRGQKPRFVFPKYRHIEHTVTLIEHGVDPSLYSRFKNLTPRVGIEFGGLKLTHWWDKYYGHSGNWTTPNALFCLNFCIEAALKFQEEESKDDRLLPYSEKFEDVIEPVGEEATIWNQSIHPPEYPMEKREGARKSVLTLKEGQPIVGVAYDNQNTLDEWFIISKDIPPDSEGIKGLGYALKKDVKRIRREK